MADITQPDAKGPSPIFARLKTAWTVSFALLLAVAILAPANLAETVIFAARALASTAQYILFAVLLLAYLKATGAEAMVARAFVGRETRMIFLAALFGGLAPFCSCEVIPFVAGLLALGAPLSAVMAFWLSSPLIDPPTLLITAAALGWPFAIAKAVVAVSLGLFGGFAVRGLMLRGAFANPLKEIKGGGCGCGPNLDGKPLWKFWTEAPRRAQFRTEFGRNALFLLKWLSLAYVLEALLVQYVPADMIAKVVGGEGVMPIITAAFVGMPAYLNSYVAPPLVAGLMDQGMSAGAGMAFIVAGAVSSVPAMAAVWSLVKPRVFAVYLGLGLSGAIIAGMVFQMV
jgi:uncharacterized protein